jgi:hypothetical protein
MSEETILALKKKLECVTEVGVKTNRAQKIRHGDHYCRFKKNSVVILENTLLTLMLNEPSAKLGDSSFDSQNMQPTIRFLICCKQARCNCC